VSDAKVRLHADRDLCIGAGLCVYADEAVFDQDDDGIVTLLVDEPEDSEAVRRAVAGCPSGALRLEEI
jgi:ferredoxin